MLSYNPLILVTFLSIALWSNSAHSQGAVQFFHSGDRVLFIGDSITQDGRYVDLIRGYLWTQYPELDITVLNAGLGSETVSGITEPIHPFPRPNILDRLDRALELTRPDIVFVCYGMNDGIYHPFEPRIGEGYRIGIESILAKIDDAGAKAVLLAPPVFDADAPPIVKAIENAKSDEPYGYQKPYEHYDNTLVSLTNILQEFERDSRVLKYIDVHASTHDFLVLSKKENPDFVYGDGVHPPLEGHAAIARSILFGLGESESRLESQMSKFFAVRPPGAGELELPEHELAGEIQKRLFARGRKLNAGLRELIDPKNSSRPDIDSALDPLLQKANDDAAEIKNLIEQVKRSF